MFQFLYFPMNLFYQSDPGRFELDEEESRHCTKVLRLVSGDLIDVTDGRGAHLKCQITVGAKRVTYRVLDSTHIASKAYSVVMAVAPTRKAERNEWMVEKMTEIGVDTILFLMTANTNKETFSRVVNLARLNRIAESAMKQSQQFYKPEISVLTDFEKFVTDTHADNKLIAYVPDNLSASHVFEKTKRNSKTLLLIGPEGDFTPGEVAVAIRNGFDTVSLGVNRLRTETAAVAGCHAIQLAQLVKE
jgi:16S rRNA (uracil1498-N3)-methyltransferase